MGPRTNAAKYGRSAAPAANAADDCPIARALPDRIRRPLFQQVVERAPIALGTAGGARAGHLRAGVKGKLALPKVPTLGSDGWFWFEGFWFGGSGQANNGSRLRLQEFVLKPEA